MKPRKVCFRLQPDRDGYPPFAAENLWATPTDLGDELVLDNIPFFVRVATIGDTIEASREDGELVFRRVLRRSPRSLLRVVSHDPANVPSIRAQLHDLGCATEEFCGRPLVAVDVPLTIDLTAVQRLLADLSARDLADYEEAILRHPETSSGGQD